MLEQILEFLEPAGGLIDLFAVGVIVVGFAHSLGRYAVQYNERGPEKDFAQFKVGLGRALALGLEILVVADVIKTITTEPTFNWLGVLAFLVFVRTIVSWTLILEMEGRWPWQTPPEERRE